MKKKLLIMILIILSVLFGIFLIWLRGSEDFWLCQNGQWVKHGHPSKTSPTTGCGSQAATSTDNISTSTDQNKPPVANITISSPVDNQTVSQLFVITGQARVFESALVVRVLTSAGTKILEQPVMANAPDVGQFGPYVYQVDLNSYPWVEAGKLIVEALDYSPKDGSEIDKVSAEINYLPAVESDVR